MTTLIIARHGNTFNPADTPTRVGARTDLPLVESGEEQARKIGRFLKSQNLIPEVTYCSQLLRTKQTAQIALKEIGFAQPVFPLQIFNEIDYGADENQTEETVIARIGAQAIKDWDEKAIVPDGWQFNPQACINNWKNFAKQILKDCHPEEQGDEGFHTVNEIPRFARNDKTVVLVVTSNGIARFAPHITGDFDSFAKTHSLKLSTGALAIFEYKSDQWVIKGWNIKP